MDSPPSRASSARSDARVDTLGGPTTGEYVDQSGWALAWVILVFVVDVTVRVLAIIFVPRNRRPTAAMAWLLAIYFIPIIGVVLFLLIGNPRLPRTRRR